MLYFVHLDEMLKNTACYKKNVVIQPKLSQNIYIINLNVAHVLSLYFYMYVNISNLRLKSLYLNKMEMYFVSIGTPILF